MFNSNPILDPKIDNYAKFTQEVYRAVNFAFDDLERCFNKLMDEKCSCIDRPSVYSIGSSVYVRKSESGNEFVVFTVECFTCGNSVSRERLTDA